jgi:DNA-directed RNA polymerase specialized sigma24 family protein
MTSESSPTIPPPGPAAQPQQHAPFHTTRWTRVCLAKADSDDGRRALADLCDAYYEPVVAYLRRVLHDADAARDMSHAFFAGMLAGGTIETADPTRGRFRSYLLGAVKHFLSHQREAALRLKRGGGRELLPMDDEEAIAVADTKRGSPDAEFDKQWAVTVLGRALEALQQESRAQGRGEVFERVKPLLTGDCDHGEQAAIAAACGLNAASFRMAVHRLRKRLRQCVKTEVAGTLEDPAMVEEEMRALFSALGN